MQTRNADGLIPAGRSSAFSGGVTGLLVGLVAALSLSGCAGMNSTPYPANPDVASSGRAYSDNTYSGFGVVRSIERVQAEKGGIGGTGVGLGTLAGAVIGGVVGNQVGAGRGNTVATVAGVAGGAYVGHELEGRQAATAEAYRITVRMENGENQVLTQSSNNGLRVGDRVRLDNGKLERY
jgi:outer membrane lipoprotein SlyB